MRAPSSANATRSYDPACWNCAGPRPLTLSIAKSPADELRAISLPPPAVLYPYSYDTVAIAYAYEAGGEGECRRMARSSVTLHMFGKETNALVSLGSACLARASPRSLHAWPQPAQPGSVIQLALCSNTLALRQHRTLDCPMVQQALARPAATAAPEWAMGLWLQAPRVIALSQRTGGRLVGLDAVCALALGGVHLLLTGALLCTQLRLGGSAAGAARFAMEVEATGAAGACSVFPLATLGLVVMARQQRLCLLSRRQQRGHSGRVL